MDETNGDEDFWIDLFKTAMPGDPRPGDFPRELPFIANLPARYGQTSDRIECQWHVAEDPVESPELPQDDRAMAGRYAYLRRRTNSVTSPTGPLGVAWSFDESQEMIKSAIDSIANEVAAAMLDFGWVPVAVENVQPQMRTFHSFTRDGWGLTVWSIIKELSGGVQVTAELGGPGF